MALLSLYYATNRNHIGTDRFKPTGYGTKFSDDGIENLRFGRVMADVDDGVVAGFLKAKVKGCGIGDGIGLADYFSECAKEALIEAYPESIDPTINQSSQPAAKLGSKAMFSDVMEDMFSLSDALICIHGFNVTWCEAVGSALALQTMLQNCVTRDPKQDIRVILFSWPSDGMALPFVSYKSDRTEATGSGQAVGRGFLKARDFLADLRDRAKTAGQPLCGQDIHLLCHSMGNYLLQSALAKTLDFTASATLPRLFEHVFLCAPDVDDNALEEGGALVAVDQISRQVTLYHNCNDKAMVISDYTKGNPERLGGAGAAHPALLHNKVHQVDCTPVTTGTGLSQHSYYLAGNINADIRASIDGFVQTDASRRRTRHPTLNNVWTMK